MGRGVEGDTGFNAPSRYSIYKKAMAVAGEECSWERFVTFDAPARASALRKASAAPMPAGRISTARPLWGGRRWAEAD